MNTTGISESHNGTGQGITIPLLGNSSTGFKESMSQASYLMTTQTYYNAQDNEDSFNTDFYNLIFDTGTYYWLATRVTNLEQGYAEFGILDVDFSSIYGNMIFQSNGTQSDWGCYIAPVISLTSKIQYTKKSDGTWDISN